MDLPTIDKRIVVTMAQKTKVTLWTQTNTEPCRVVAFIIVQTSSSQSSNHYCDYFFREHLIKLLEEEAREKDRFYQELESLTQQIRRIPLPSADKVRTNFALHI